MSVASRPSAAVGRLDLLDDHLLAKILASVPRIGRAAAACKRLNRVADAGRLLQAMRPDKRRDWTEAPTATHLPMPNRLCTRALAITEDCAVYAEQDNLLLVSLPCAVAADASSRPLALAAPTTRSRV